MTLSLCFLGRTRFHFNKHAFIQDQISLATTIVTSEPLEFYYITTCLVRNNPRKRGEKLEQAEVLQLKKNRKNLHHRVEVAVAA